MVLRMPQKVLRMKGLSFNNSPTQRYAAKWSYGLGVVHEMDVTSNMLQVEPSDADLRSDKIMRSKSSLST